MEKVYGYDKALDVYVVREPHKRHGDGQQDTNENPVWLLADREEIVRAGLDPETLPEVDSSNGN